MEDELQAHLLTCNQDVDTACLMMINATIKEAQDEALRWKDKQATHAQDQVVLVVINSKPPPFSTDPHIKAWVTRHAEATHSQAETKMMEEAII